MARDLFQEAGISPGGRDLFEESGIAPPEKPAGRKLLDAAQDVGASIASGAKTAGDYGHAVSQALGEGLMNLQAGLGTFVQAPAANTLSGVLGARALASRGITAAQNWVSPGSATLDEGVQRDAQLASRFAAEQRAANADIEGGSWLNPRTAIARIGLGLQEDARTRAAEIQAKSAAENPELIRQQQAVAAAEGFVPTVKAMAQNPMATTHTLARSAPDMVLGLALARAAAAQKMAAGATAAEAAAARAAAAGATAEAQAAVSKTVIDAAAKEAVARASTVGALAEGASSANSAREGVYREVMAIPTTKLAESPRFRAIMAETGGDAVRAQQVLANELADQAPLLAAAGTLTGSALTRRIFGGDTTARAVAGQRIGIKDVGRNILEEGTEEGLQGVPEDLVQHGATVQADPSKQFDLGGTLAQNVVAGALMGGGGTGARATQQAVQDFRRPAGAAGGAAGPAGQAIDASEVLGQPGGAADASISEVAVAEPKWQAFTPESGTLGVPRAEMPQIEAGHRGALVQFLGGRGITHEQVELDGTKLRPTQAEFDPAKVAAMAADPGASSRSVLVSSDGYVLDGHHQWLAAVEAGTPVKAIRLDAPIRELLTVVPQFPSAGQAGGAPGVVAPATAETSIFTPGGKTALEEVDEIDGQLAARAADSPEAAALRARRDEITATWPKAARGAETTFSTEAGVRLGAQYAVVDVGDLVTSHDAHLRPNPAYPQELQPRDRSRAASSQQIAGIVTKIDPARLGQSADAATGAPIIGADGLVESGNARSIALQRIYRAKGQKAEDYKAWLRQNAEQFGLTAEQVGQLEQPVLVRIRTTPVNRAEFARQANASTVAQMSPAELARADAARIDAMDDLQPDEQGDFATSRDFIRRFVGRLPGTEQAGMVDASGQLSSAGYARVRNAVLAKAYGDSPVLTRMVESMDDRLRNISRALMIAAPTVAQARAAIDAGALHDADLVPDLVEAVEVLARLKEQGVTVEDALAQAGIFVEQFSPETRTLLAFLGENTRRPRRIAEFITAYYRALDAVGDPRQDSLLGPADAPARSDLIEAARRETNPPQRETEGAQDAAEDAQRRDAGEAAGNRATDRGQPEAATDDRGRDQGDGAAGPAAAAEAGAPATRLSTRPTEAGERAALRVLSQTDELFALPKSDGKTVEDIAADIDPGIKVQKLTGIPGVVEAFAITTPPRPGRRDGEQVGRLYVRAPNPYGPTLYGFDLKEGEISNAYEGRPGENPEAIPPDVQDVYIDVSKLKTGGGGSMLYAIAAAYAHNTDRVFIGDPAGLSDAAMRRRSEQMLSSALKYGTTAHLAPHPRQEAGAPSLGVPPLRWVYGDDLGNIRRLVEVNLKAMENAGYDDTVISFDPGTGRFRDSGGQELSRAGIEALASADLGRGADAGGATLARAAVFRALLREEGGAGPAGGRRDGLLARLAGLADDSPQAVKGILYSRATAAPKSSITFGALLGVVGRIALKLPGLPRVSVLRSVADAPEALQTIIAERGAADTVEGAFHDGQIYLFASGIADEARAEHVLAEHEAAHVGLAGMLGDRLPQSMQAISNQNPKIRKAAVDLQAANPGMSHVEAVEEILVDIPSAELAQLKGWRGLVDRVRGWLASSGFTKLAAQLKGWLDGTITEQQRADLAVAELVLAARDFVKQPGAAAGTTRLSVADATAAAAPTVADRAESIIQTAASTPKPVDALAKAVTKYSGIERAAALLYGAGARLVDRLMATAPGQRLAAGFVSDYGVPEAVIDQRAMMQGRQRQQLRGAGTLLEKLATMTRAESRVAYAWMTGEDPRSADELMKDLPKQSVEVLQEVRTLIDQLSAEAVRLGQLDAEARDRHRFAYLRRSYFKHARELNATDKAKRQRAISILGDQYKGRGMTVAAPMRQIQNTAPEWWKRKTVDGKADTSLKGEKFVRLERRAPSGEGTAPLEGMEGKQPGKLLEVHYFPAGEPMPAKYADWDNAGTWEARNTKGADVVLWRDFTKAEREKMGEIDEARFAIAKTLQGMVHDIEVGRYLEWLSTNHAKKPGEEISGEVVEASERYRDTFTPGQWVQVPDTKIPGTAVLKYGALAGRYLPGPIWNDLRQVVGGQPRPLGETFQKILSLWKMSKTALSPGVHTNNVMSNFVMADWHDVTAGHVAKALRIVLAANRGDGRGALGRAGNALGRAGIADREAAREVLTRYQDSGGAIGGWLTQEIASEQLEPIVAALERELNTTAAAAVPTEIGVYSALQHAMHLRFPQAWAAFKASKPVDALGTEAKNLLELYQAEDDVFRLAAWLKAKEGGATDAAAGKVARKSFLDYSINAPWVQLMRATAFPFISFTYRALPMLLETAGKRPHKLLKLMALAGGLNWLGVMLGGGGDDRERKLLPEEKAGGVWGLVPKLIRLPWNDANGSPVYLDIRRWIPVGDVADLGQGHAAVPVPPSLMPGGPLAVAAEVLLNRSMFTGKEISLSTDTGAEKAAKVADHLWKAAVPNVLVVPGTYATTGVVDAATGRTDAFGREQSVAQATASAFGVKVGSYPPDVLRRNLIAKAKGEEMEIDRQISALKRQRQTNRITQDELREQVLAQEAKKAAIRRGLMEKLN